MMKTKRLICRIILTRGFLQHDSRLSHSPPKHIVAHGNQEDISHQRHCLSTELQVEESTSTAPYEVRSIAAIIDCLRRWLISVGFE
jgi:hypothetical protein